VLKINRRKFCAIATGAAASIAAGLRTSAAAAADHPFQLRYALASCLYGDMKLDEILPQLSRAGAECLDLWPSPHGNQREAIDELGVDKFRELLSRYDVRLGLTTRYDLGPFGLDEELRHVAKLGGNLVVTGSNRAKGLSAAETKSVVREFVRKMSPHVAVAEKCGVTIAIENHVRTLIDSPDSLKYLAEFSPSTRLGIAMAPYHLPQDAKLLADLIESLGPNLVHFYAWQYGCGCTKKMPKEKELEQLPGRGKLSFRPLLEALRRIEYRGFTEIFMHTTPRGLPIRDSAAEVTDEINRARKYLEDCLR